MLMIEYLNCRKMPKIVSMMLALVCSSLSLTSYAESKTEVVDQGAQTENVEQHLPLSSSIQEWVQQDQKEKEQAAKKVELKKVLEQTVKTVKLENVVPPIEFKSGQADIPENYVTLLRDILAGMKNRVNVRLHFIGHTDDVKLTGSLQKKYGDNVGLSKERAGTTAEFFQRALHLPPEAISFDGKGELEPVASNKTNAGRTKNRRVEVEVLYDQIDEKMVEKEVEIKQDLKRIKVCRIETVCKIRYKAGHSKRARLKNLVPALRYEEGVTDIPPQFIQQLKEALHNLRNKKNVQIKLIGHTDNIPLTGRLGRIYGEHGALSKARARRMALAVREKMRLPQKAVSSVVKARPGRWPLMMWQQGVPPITASKWNSGTMICWRIFLKNHSSVQKRPVLKPSPVCLNHRPVMSNRCILKKDNRLFHRVMSVV